MNFAPAMRISILSFLLVSADMAWSKEANRVAVRAEASREYILSRARDESSKLQTYHLIEGKYFGGNVADGSMEEITFQDIADQLAINLRRQNYFSEEDPNSGDLLIMVHYGASNFISEEEDAEVFDIGDYLPPVQKANGETYEYELSRNALPKFWGQVSPEDRPRLKEEYFRSRILGMDDIFSSKVTSYEAYVQRELAAEGRYFIILTAFDLPLLKQGEKKVLWTTRYSIRIIGQTFNEAIKELNFVAGHYFGKNLKGLISRRATDESLVEMGEIEVVE